MWKRKGVKVKENCRKLVILENQIPLRRIMVNSRSLLKEKEL